MISGRNTKTASTSEDARRDATHGLTVMDGDDETCNSDGRPTDRPECVVLDKQETDGRVVSPSGCIVNK